MTWHPASIRQADGNLCCGCRPDCGRDGLRQSRKAQGVDPALTPWAQRLSLNTAEGYPLVVRLKEGENPEFVEPIVDGLTVGDDAPVVRTSDART